MTWRDKYKVHPAADVFPMMPDDELDDLGKNIAENGLRDPIKILRTGKAQKVEGYENAFTQPIVLLDGRNRLAAMERVGIDLDSCAVKFQYVNSSRGPFTFDAVAYVIAANIRRRHLTKQQQGELIVLAIKAGEKLDQVEPVSKGGRGKKNPIKEKAVAAGAEHGISEATIKRAIAKSEGKTPKAKPPVEGSDEYERDRKECIALYQKAFPEDAKAEGKAPAPKLSPEDTRLEKLFYGLGALQKFCRDVNKLPMPTWWGPSTPPKDALAIIREARALLRELAKKIEATAARDDETEEAKTGQEEANAPDKAVAPAEVLQDQGERGDDTYEEDESTARRAKRKPKNVWVEEGGRYLYRYGDTGCTVFDVWKLIGPPLPRRGRA